MKEESRAYHQQVLSTHNTTMYSTLIHPHCVRSETLKEIELKQSNEEEILTTRGFFAVKDRNKYWITPKFIDSLPVRVEEDECDIYTYKEDVLMYPKNPKIFKIIPEKCFNDTEFLDHFLCFDNSNPVAWDLLRIIGIASMIGRTYICLASNPSLGKTSVFDVLHALTDKCPVFKPRSVPGVLHQITGEGNMVFDDVLEAKKDVREIMEEMCLQIGGWRAVYINGALKTSQTKREYNVWNQSITFLYNRVEDYANSEERYFDVMFENNAAIDNRFLKLKLQGELTEDFKVDFDIEQEAEDRKMYYIKMAKHLLWLQQQKRQNLIQKKYHPKHKLLQLKGRRKDVFNELDTIMNLFAKSQEQYDTWYTAIEQAVIDYKSMFNHQDGRFNLKQEKL